MTVKPEKNAKCYNASICGQPETVLLMSTGLLGTKYYSGPCLQYKGTLDKLIYKHVTTKSLCIQWLLYIFIMPFSSGSPSTFQ